MTFKNLQRGIVTLNKRLVPHTFYRKNSSTNHATCRNESHKFVQFIQSNRPSVVSSGIMCLCNSALLNISKQGLIKKNAEQKKRTAPYDARCGI